MISGGERCEQYALVRVTAIEVQVLLFGWNIQAV